MGIAVAAIIIGLIELFFGRMLFWLFVAVGGFILGWFLIPDLTSAITGWTRVLLGVGLGVIFALLAIVFVRVMVAVGGFFVFGAAAVILARDIGITAVARSSSYWVLYVIGGLVGAILLFLFLDWAIIVLTSIAGAGATARGIFHFVGHPRWTEWVMFVVWLTLGIVIQARHYRGAPALGARRTRKLFAAE